jgi:hypothetical protein
MNLESGLAAVQTFFGLGDLVNKAWGGYAKWRNPVTITYPPNRHIVYERKVQLEGECKHLERGHFWLVTKNGERYWLQARINPASDGCWKATVDVGGSPDSRTSTVLLVRVSGFANALFADIKARSNKTECHDPVNIPRAPRQFLVVDCRDLNVELKNV